MEVGVFVTSIFKQAKREVPLVKTKILLTLREILIYLIIVGLMILGAYLLLKSYYPTEKIPQASKYTVLDRDNYKVIGDIQNEQNPTVIYDTKTPRIETDQTELRYIPGSVNPFVAERGGSDLPSDTVSKSSSSSSSSGWIDSDSSENSSESSSDSESTETNEDVQDTEEE